MKLPKSRLLKLSAIYAIILSALILITIIVSIILGDKVVMVGDYRYDNETEIFSVADINKINTQIYNGNINITDNPTDEIKVILNGNSHSNIKVAKSGSTLDVLQSRKWFNFTPFGIFGLNNSLEVTILIPSTYNHNINAGCVNDVINISNIKANILSLDNVSGDIELSNMECIALGIDSVSGAINVNSIISDKVDINIVSGRIYLTNTSANELKLDKISADADLRFINAPRYIDIDTVSGDTVIDLPDDTIVNIKSDTVSGDINNTLTNALGANCMINLNSISGDTDIN